MAIKYYGTNTTATRYPVSKTKDSRIVRAMWINGWYAVLKQTTTTTVEHYEGVGADSLNEILALSGETSTLNNTTRSYLGGATVTYGGSWMHCDDCWGTRVTVATRTISPHMWAADVTTEVIDVVAGSGSLTKT